MKAIMTKYHGPTDFKGSRITAEAGSNRVTVPYDHALDADGNHDAAALALCVNMDWTQHHLMRGTLENRQRQSIGNVYTFDDHGNRLPIPEAVRDAAYLKRNHEAKTR